jgi:class 3 adenylate cyclase
MQSGRSLTLASTGNSSLAAVSDRGPGTGEPPRAERFLVVGGCRSGLSGAAPALVDAEPPHPVPRPGADFLVGALLTALEASLAVRTTASPAHPTSENVTVLFTDLVGWTKMSRRLRPETADEVRRRHFLTLARVIGAAGGTEVKRLGDGTMVAFTTASAALSCAVEMQREVDRDNRSSANPLGLRVGLSGGDVTREASDYFGDPVVEAARLCAIAEGGQIVTARVVKDMAGRRGQLRYRPLGRPELKGISDPFETFEVEWNPFPAHEVPQHPAAMPSGHDLVPAPSASSSHPGRERLFHQ